jgi:hypothetical protein
VIKERTGWIDAISMTAPKHEQMIKSLQNVDRWTKAWDVDAKSLHNKFVEALYMKETYEERHFSGEARRFGRITLAPLHR